VLFVLFHHGEGRYALDARVVAEVLPLVALTKIHGAPPEVAGIFNYRGEPVPVVDASQLLGGRPSERRLSTRLILVHYAPDQGQARLLGLIAERATGMVRHEPRDFVSSGISSDRAAYLGPVATDAQGMLQWVDVKTLLPAAVRDALFRAPVEQEWLTPTSKIS
jgi:chemotaxis-related protein WspB